VTDNQLISRKTLLRTGALGGAGLLAAALLGCGSDDEGSPAASSSATAAATAEPGVIRDPNLPYPFQAPDPAGAPKTGGTMRYGTTYAISIFDPAKTSAGGTLMVTNFVYNRLLGFKRGVDMDPFRLDLIPELASSWERTPDGLTYTFKLVSNAKFHNVAPVNGRTLVADDVKFSYDRYAAGGPQQSYFANVASVDAVNPTTLKITMKRPVADFIMPLAGRYIPIIPKELVDDGSIEKKAIGTGPMLLKEAIDGQRAYFERNPEYFQRPVLLDAFEYKIIPAPAARLAAFRSRQIDYGYPFVDNITDAKNLEKTTPDVRFFMSAPLNTTFTVAFNLDLPKYKDDRVRQGLALAVDHNTIINVVLDKLGLALPAIPWPFVFDKLPTGDQLGRFMKFDPAEGKRLLDAAGAAGLEINSNYYQYTSTNSRVSDLLVDQLRAVGVTLKNQQADYTEFNSQWVGAKIADATTSGWGTAGFDADNWFYNQIHSKSPGNRWRIKDAQSDTWAEQQQVELDPAKRREIHRKLWDYHNEKQYRLSTPVGYGFTPLQPWVRGVRGGNWGNSLSYDDGAIVGAGAWLDK